MSTIEERDDVLEMPDPQGDIEKARSPNDQGGPTPTQELFGGRRQTLRRASNILPASIRDNLICLDIGRQCPLGANNNVIRNFLDRPIVSYTDRESAIQEFSWVMENLLWRPAPLNWDVVLGEEPVAVRSEMMRIAQKVLFEKRGATTIMHVVIGGPSPDAAVVTLLQRNGEAQQLSLDELPSHDIFALCDSYTLPFVEIQPRITRPNLREGRAFLSAFHYFKLLRIVREKKGLCSINETNTFPGQCHGKSLFWWQNQVDRSAISPDFNSDDEPEEVDPFSRKDLTPDMVSWQLGLREDINGGRDVLCGLGVSSDVRRETQERRVDFTATIRPSEHLAQMCRAGLYLLNAIPTYRNEPISIAEYLCNALASDKRVQRSAGQQGLQKISEQSGRTTLLHFASPIAARRFYMRALLQGIRFGQEPNASILSITLPFHCTHDAAFELGERFKALWI